MINLTNKFKQIKGFIEHLPVRWFILAITALSYIGIIPFFPIFLFLLRIGKTMGDPLTGKSYFAKFLLASIIIPPLETLLFQRLPIKMLRKVFGWPSIKLIFASAVFFGIMHFYSIAYIFLSFLIGILLAYSYILYEEKQGSPFWVVTAIHALRNTISIALMLLFER